MRKGEKGERERKREREREREEKRINERKSLASSLKLTQTH